MTKKQRKERQRRKNTKKRRNRINNDFHFGRHAVAKAWACSLLALFRDCATCFPGNQRK